MSEFPEFLLVCEASSGGPEHFGTWRFVLEQLDGQPFLEASDEEWGDANRLSLLAVVRGLEALPGPASVTMLSSSRYVIRSLSDSLPRWREAGYVWEHFGQRLEVTNADLWRRVDRALDIHAVSACCVAAAPNVGRRVPRQPVAADQSAAPHWTAHPAQTPHVQAPHVQTPHVAGQRPDSWSEVTDGLRRWLIGQCRSVTGGYGRPGYAHSSAGQLAVA